jgi:NADPH-dependent curcumin reductase CurA
MHPDVRSYVPPVKIDEIMRGFALGKVTASKSSKFKVGDYVQGTPGWTEIAIVKEKHLEPVIIPPGGRLTDVMGVLGITGLTAYFGLLSVGQVKAGDFVVVSGAAGATGSVVCQIAKLKGATVLGLAGTDEKVSWLKEMGCDNALNYKSPNFFKEFRDATKQLIDVFFDNVGGEILDMALGRAKQHARFVICGGISQYNSRGSWGPKNYLMIVSMRIRMEGFIVMDYEKDYPKARADLSKWLSEGKLQRKETIVKGGLKKAEAALAELYNGMNTGALRCCND